MLKLKNINVTVNKGSQLQTTVLKDLNLHVADGEFVIIVGSNGSGKSTMFNTISGFMQADSGNVIIDNQNVTQQAQSKRADLVSIVMQDPRVGTMENMTIEENMSFAYMRDKARTLKLHSRLERRKLFIERLAMLEMGLEDRLDEIVGNLSGGQRQALSLIMAIIADYKILLLDEITAALDPKTADNVMKIAAKLVREEGRTAIMITHNMQHALSYGDRLVILAQAKIVRDYDAKAKADLSMLQLAACFND